MKNYAEIKKKLEVRKDRSAWDKGVTLYALELLDEVARHIDYTGKEPETREEFKEYALNGATNWIQYSWSGLSLIYDCDIAKRLCTPSKLKRTRGGELRPNGCEEWLDTQARALNHAFQLLATTWKYITLNDILE